MGFSLVEGLKHWLTEHYILSMMQAPSHCYPTDSYMARNSCRDPATGVCRLCRLQVESYGHIQVGCKELQDNHRTTHNIVAEAILGGIRRGSKGLVIMAEGCKTGREPGGAMRGAWSFEIRS